MKDTNEFVIPGESVFLEMEEFHKTEAKNTESHGCGDAESIVHKSFPFFIKGWEKMIHPSYVSYTKKKTLGIPTTCTLN